MIRKVALIGCREGSWVRTKNFRNLTLDANVHADALISVIRRSDDGTLSPLTFIGPGKHNLDSSDWCQVHIPDGPFEHSIVQLIGA